MSNEPNVYFKDPVTGEEYISSPEQDVMTPIAVMLLIAVSMPALLGAVFYLTMK